MMFLLLTLIVMIAAFNTVSGLSMMVKEKESEIAVLRTMGLTPNDIMAVFIVQGSVVGVGGVLRQGWSGEGEKGDKRRRDGGNYP